MTTLEERVQALEERECYDDTDIKEKMGYNDVPSGSNIQAEIDALEPEYVKSLFEDMLDEAISEETQSVTRTLSFSVLYDGLRTPVQGVSIWLDSADDDTFKGVTGNAGGCTISNVIDGEHRIFFKDNGGWVEPLSINGSSTVNKIEVSENQILFEILLYNSEPEVTTQ